MNLVKLVFASLISYATAEQLILDPPASAASGKPVAMVWIHGMQCKPQAYKTLGQEIQNVAASQGLKLWIGLPEFPFDAPEPVLIDHYVQETIGDLSKHGFSGNNLFIGAHSLGGVMSQNYVASKPDMFKGLILTGSGILNNTYSI